MNTAAVILAAGMGRRMGSDLPKVLHELDGRPLVTYSIERARTAGADAVVVIVGYRKELVEGALADQETLGINDLHHLSFAASCPTSSTPKASMT